MTGIRGPKRPEDQAGDEPSGESEDTPNADAGEQLQETVQQLLESGEEASQRGDGELLAGVQELLDQSNQEGGAGDPPSLEELTEQLQSGR